jgi:hypothetical protein
MIYYSIAFIIFVGPIFLVISLLEDYVTKRYSKELPLKIKNNIATLYIAVFLFTYFIELAILFVVIGKTTFTSALFKALCLLAPCFLIIYWQFRILNRYDRSNQLTSPAP